MGKPAHNRRFPSTLPEAEFTISFSYKMTPVETNFYILFYLFIYLVPTAVWEPALSSFCLQLFGTVR